MQTRSTKTSIARAFAAVLLATVGTAQAAPAFTPDDQPIGFMAQPRLTSLDVRNGGQLAYYVDYEKQHWSGNVVAYEVGANGRVDLGADIWPGGTAPVINQQHWDTGRKIATLKLDGTKIPFRWVNLHNDQKKPGLGDKELYLQYIRGDRSNESPAGLKLRVRRYTMGSIIRSRPAYVAGTNPMLYVGANDGMLHAINANTGEEVYAYIPSMVIPRLILLAPLQTAGYTNKHFVDATPRVRDVTIGGVAKRVLVGGLGAGGRGLWSLDITDDATTVPANETAVANKIMWEKTNASAGYANLGYTYGEPIIGKANNGADVIFMANGYMSTTGKATLYVINPADGSVVREIDTLSGAAGNPNGLSSPTPVDVNGDGKIDFLYAGDLDGKMWKFDVTSNAPASWTVSALHTTSPLQAITSAPAVSEHPRGGRMVIFGTGRTLTPGDMSDTAVHYMYGVWDGAPVGNAAWLTQTFSAVKDYADPALGVSRRVRTLTINAPDWTTHRGWKVALSAGERFVGDRFTITNGRVYAHAFNPTTNQSGLTKTPIEPIGENWEYQFEFLSGGGTVKPILDLNMDSKFDNADLLPDAGGTPMQDRAAAGMFLNPGVLSQPVVVASTVGAQDLYTQNPDLPSIPIGDPGVSGGHFDVDLYYPTKCDAANVCSGYASQKHVHEYDDKYGVTGVNMLNASSSDLNLARASISVKQAAPQTEFKVLVMNQYLNPAAKLKIGPDGTFTDVKLWNNQASTADAATVLANAATYTFGTIGQLVMGLPMNAFASLDWWGVGDIRAGLIPTATGCVKGISDSNFASTAGPQGERHNGALTVQLIRANTPANALELNVAGKPEYGWRVKATEYKKHVLALWTFFWHHPSGKCYGAGGWVKDAPQDNSGGTPGTPPPGTDDPRDGVFRNTGNNSGGEKCDGAVTQSTVSYDINTRTRTVTETYAGGCKMVIVITRDGFGGVTTTTTITKGNVVVASEIAKTRDVDEWRPSNVRSGVKNGRISWRELIRE